MDKRLLIGVSVLILVVMVGISFLLSPLMCDFKVGASGAVDLAIDSQLNGGGDKAGAIKVQQDITQAALWAALGASDTATTGFNATSYSPQGSTSVVLRYRPDNNPDYVQLDSGLWCFNDPLYNPSVINTAKVHVNVSFLQQYASYNMGVALYTFHNGDGVILPGEFGKSRDEAEMDQVSGDYFGRVTDWYYTDAAGLGWKEFDILPAALDYIRPDVKGNIIFYVGIKCYMEDSNYPAFAAWSDYTQITFENSAGSHMHLDINYVPKISTQRTLTPGTNAATGTKTVSGSVTAITWNTTRYCFNNDNVVTFRVQGTQYLGLTLVLETDTGVTLLSASDQVRLGGYFYWNIQIPANYVGFMRCRDTTSSTVSEWGYSSKPLPASMPSNTVVACSVSEKPYYDAFSVYKKADKDVFAIYWKTNIGTAELADHALTLKYKGAAGSYAFNQDFGVIWTNYQKGQLAGNNVAMATSYMLFVFNGGGDFSDKGLICNLAYDSEMSRWGLYYPAIYKYTTVADLTTTINPVFYLPENEIGFNFVAPNQKVKLDESYETSLYVGEYSSLLNDFNLLNYAKLDDSGLAYTDTDLVISAKNTKIDNIAFPGAGVYTIKLTFTHATNLGSYIFCKDVMTQGTAGGTDPGGPSTPGGDIKPISETIDSLLARWGMDNVLGHWIFMIILMGIALVLMLFPIFKSNGMTRNMMFATLLLIETGIMGAFVASEFIDKWVIILIAFGVGGVIIVMMGKFLTGGSSQHE